MGDEIVRTKGATGMWRGTIPIWKVRRENVVGRRGTSAACDTLNADLNHDLHVS